MIGQLTGEIAYQEKRFVIVKANGVGYKVYVSPETIKELPVSSELRMLWTHLVVREEVLDLYGFISKEELDFFQLLIGVSGVGPRSALAILSLASPATLREAIGAGNSSYLTQVSGIGKKIAEKIILELRDKIEYLESENNGLSEASEAILALEALGYSNKEAREALKQVDPKIIDTGDKIKSALKNLHHKN